MPEKCLQKSDINFSAVEGCRVQKLSYIIFYRGHSERSAVIEECSFVCGCFESYREVLQNFNKTINGTLRLYAFLISDCSRKMLEVTADLLVQLKI